MHKSIAYTIIFLGVVVIVLISSFFKYKKNFKTNKALSALKKSGKKISVHFQDCEIKTRDYFESKTSDSIPTRIEMLDSLYNPNHSYEGTKKVVSVIIYRYKDPFGKNIEFRSEPIEMSDETLRYILENRKKTTIFVDKNNWNYYYFDLEFLYSHASMPH